MGEEVSTSVLVEAVQSVTGWDYETCIEYIQRNGIYQAGQLDEIFETADEEEE